ncbi:uncharacterized protein [Musca autumnalis]|uniref:uncharacterized protein n=1 Tax=Musca autumnalis TaxID=221902 RepID=UPI003CF041E4
MEHQRPHLKTKAYYKQRWQDSQEAGPSKRVCGGTSDTAAVVTSNHLPRLWKTTAEPVQRPVAIVHPFRSESQVRTADIAEVLNQEPVTPPRSNWASANLGVVLNTDDLITPLRPGRLPPNPHTPSPFVSPGSPVIILDEDSVLEVAASEANTSTGEMSEFEELGDVYSVVTVSDEEDRVIEEPDNVVTSRVRTSPRYTAWTDTDSDGDAADSMIPGNEGVEVNLDTFELNMSPRYGELSDSVVSGLWPNPSPVSSQSGPDSPGRLRSVVVVPDARDSWCRFASREEFPREVQIRKHRMSTCTSGAAPVLAFYRITAIGVMLLLSMSEHLSACFQLRNPPSSPKQQHLLL